MRFLGILLLPGLLAAQSTQADVTGIPESDGVYYHAPSGWIGLPANPLLPMDDGNVRWILSLGRSPAIAELSGPHAAVQIPSSRPIFHLRGFSPNNAIYLVRTTPKQDYREIRMPMVNDMHNYARFRTQDLVDYNLTASGDGIATLTPKADMKAGEYTIVSLYEPSMRGIRISFDFGVTAK
ncbi:MAG TPA: hypothetical protein VMG40_11835 [Bryobacteraceae bacterium]|nr:hypothetical protein [Bryobacteraceae bacterium]